MVIWRNIDARTSKRKYLELQKRRLDRRQRLLKRAAAATTANGSANNGGDAATQAHIPPPPDELVVKRHAAREEIKRAMHEVLGLLHIDEKGPAVGVSLPLLILVLSRLLIR